MSRVPLFAVGFVGLILWSALEAQSVNPSPKHTSSNLKAAKEVQASLPEPATVDERCPLTAEKHSEATLDWKSGSMSPSEVKNPGNYCFSLTNANTILYTYAFTVNELAPSGNPFDLLKSAITSVQDLGTGAAQAKAAAGAGGTCSVSIDLTAIKSSSTNFQDALAKLDPQKDSSGKAKSIPLQDTLDAWKGVPPKFDQFDRDAQALILILRNIHDDGRDNAGADCTQDPSLPYAEAAINDGYVPARQRYVDLLKIIGSRHIARYTADLSDTSAYDVVVKEQYKGEATTAEAKTFHLNAGHAILSASAGFLITELPARAYSSRTAPLPSDPTKTQNVLGVDYGSGVRPALTALLNYNFPCQVLKDQLGLSISIGPVFDISNGKADVSRFGLLGGASIRLSKWVYLTPGVHIGEFADFPEGFTRAGQVIPAGTGTPVPTKRYTARFAFAVTFKVKDLGSGDKSPTPETKASQPKTKP